MVDSGDTVTYSVPILEGHCIPQGVHKMNLAGREITQYLEKILGERGLEFTTAAEKDLVRDIKHKLAFVSLDYEAGMAEAEGSSIYEKTYELPDESTITIGSERFRAAEHLFKPAFTGREHDGIDMITHNSILTFDSDVRKDLYGNIILSGGTTMLEGLGERL